MTFYADLPVTRARQILTDLLVAGWVYLWIRAGFWLYDMISKLAAPGRQMAHAGDGLSSNLSSAGSKVDRVPGVGDALSSPFGRAADAARSLGDAGRTLEQTVHDVAVAVSLVAVVVPLALVLFGWLPLRVRWVRRATAARRLRAGTAGRDLLALRALASQPLNRLAALDPDVAGAWRRGDPAILRSLAALELRGLGLRNLEPGTG